jgi:hypothetical protein
MWIISQRGFFSAVQKDGTTHLTVRTRVKSHAVALVGDLQKVTNSPHVAASYKVIEGAGTDYPYRVECSHDALANVMAAEIRAIDYDNFKSHLLQIGQRGFELLCAQVWTVFYNAEAKIAASEKPVKRKK